MLADLLFVPTAATYKLLFLFRRIRSSSSCCESLLLVGRYSNSRSNTKIARLHAVVHDNDFFTFSNAHLRVPSALSRFGFILISNLLIKLYGIKGVVEDNGKSRG